MLISPAATNSSYDDQHVNMLFLCPSFTSAVDNSSARETIKFATCVRDQIQINAILVILLLDAPMKLLP